MGKKKNSFGSGVARQRDEKQKEREKDGQLRGKNMQKSWGEGGGGGGKKKALEARRPKKKEPLTNLPKQSGRKNIENLTATSHCWQGNLLE